MSEHSEEISRGQRFKFGANWRAFLSTFDEERLDEAVQSLQRLLRVETLEGKRFVDMGSGSGLFSLAARTLGAEVHSFDFDPQSVECTRELARRYFPTDDSWKIEEGSVLDADYIRSLGEFDIVYSWGVLHHTGDMSLALEIASLAVKPGGTLFIAIYNDQGFISKFWTSVKKTYCSNAVGRVLMTAVFVPWFALQCCLIGLFRHGNPMTYFSEYKKKRGMSVYYDWIDWVGGYPFEVAKVEDLNEFYRERGFYIDNLVTTNRLGCNQIVFRRN